MSTVPINSSESKVCYWNFTFKGSCCIELIVFPGILIYNQILMNLFAFHRPSNTPISTIDIHNFVYTLKFFPFLITLDITRWPFCFCVSQFITTCKWRCRKCIIISIHSFFNQYSRKILYVIMCRGFGKRMRPQ